MSEIEVICLVVVSVVVFFYALAFYLSFRKSSKYVSRVVRGESMNEEIAEYLVTTDLEYFQQDEKSKNKREGKFYQSFKEYRAMRASQEKKTNTISNIVFGVFYVLVLIFLAMGIYIRVMGGEIFIGDYSYIVIESGSMSSANSNNTYLFESDGKTVKEDDGYGHDYTIHIKTFDMIQLKKIQSEDEIQLFDVVAYRNDEGDIICHRIISIVDYQDAENPELSGKHYVFRGDANSVSSDYERYGHDGSGRGLTYADFVGEFTGWTNYGLGLTVDYLKSDVGVICLASGVIVVAFYYYFDEKNNREILAQEARIADRIDESETYRFRWYLVYYRTNKKYKILTKDIYIEHDDFY